MATQLLFYYKINILKGVLMMLRSTVILLSVCLLVSPVLPQSAKISFDSRAAFEYNKVLSSDAMMGRLSGEPGAKMAAEYIVSKLKEWQLEPAGPNGSYYQDMTYEYYQPEKGVTFDIVAHNKKREFVYGEDWRQYQYSGSGTFGSNVVFAGYGISAPQKQYDEYSGLDVKGKMVLLAVDPPRGLQEKFGEEVQLQKRIKSAQEHGARGVLTFRSDSQGAGAFFRGGLTAEVYKPDFVVLSIESKIVDFMFKWQKADPRYFFQQIDATGKPQSFDLGVQSLLHFRAIFDPKRATQNVLAKIEGSDESLKNDYVILGAHMDHLGIDMAGDVLNGADDNASGTAVVMEAARVLKLNQFRPRRTIIFALWAAEEEGLLGSKYYTENPVYPLEKTVANLNLDMEGHGTGKVGVRGTYFAPEVWEILKTGLPKEIVNNTVAGRGGPGGSDHTYFLYNGVPAFMVGTEGPHFKTNRVGDVIDMIKPEILKNSGDFVVAALELLSVEPTVPNIPKRKATFYWRYQTIVNYDAPLLDAVIEQRKDVQDPDIDLQLAILPENTRLAGDALRADTMRTLFGGREKLVQTKGLALFGGSVPSGSGFMGNQPPLKTNVLLGMKGIASFRDDFRWAEVFSKQGVGFISVDQPSILFTNQVLGPDGRKLLEGLVKANLLLIAKGLDGAQTKLLLENTRKPIMVHASSVPDKEVLDLFTKTGSVLGLVLGKDEDAASYFSKVDQVKKAIGTENLAVVAQSSLWENAAREQMLNVISEFLRAKYDNQDLTNLFSGAFTRAVNRARIEEPSRP
jgi:aminopeptidase YwaD